jgi:hypothetical protein
MLIDLDPTSGALRLDDEGVTALLEAARQDGAADHPDAVAALAADHLRAAVAVIREPAVTLRLVVAGEAVRLEHRGWLTPGAGALLLGVRPGLWQLMALDPAFLAAALVRLTRMRPRRRVDGPGDRPAAGRLADLVDPDPGLRRAALSAAGAQLAWQLRLEWPGGEREATAVDGPQGIHLADPATGELRPASNTEVYRVLSTALPREAVATAAG